MNREPTLKSFVVAQAPPPDLSAGPCVDGDHDPELWYSDNTDEQAEAKRLCNTECPVRRLCLEATQIAESARGAGYRYGIAGGLTGRQRYRRVQNEAKRARTEVKATGQDYPVTGRIAPSLGVRRAS